MDFVEVGPDGYGDGGGGGGVGGLDTRDSGSGCSKYGAGGRVEFQVEEDGCEGKEVVLTRDELEKEYTALKTKENEDQIELRRLRTENRLLRQRIDNLEKSEAKLIRQTEESATLADHLVQDQVTRAQEAEEIYSLRNELSVTRQQLSDTKTKLLDAQDIIGDIRKRTRIIEDAVYLDQGEEQNMVKHLQEELIAVRLRETETADIIKGLKVKIADLEDTNQRLQRAPSNDVQQLQEELIAVKLREAEANLSLKELKMKVNEIEKYWEAHMERIRQSSPKDKGTKTELRQLQEEVMTIKTKETKACIETKEVRQKLMEMETQNHIVTNQIRRMGEDNKDTKKLLEEAEQREKDLKTNLKDLSRRLDDTESKRREEGMMARILEAENVQQLAEFRHKIAEIDIQNEELLAACKLLDREGNQDLENRVFDLQDEILKLKMSAHRQNFKAGHSLMSDSFMGNNSDEEVDAEINDSKNLDKTLSDIIEGRSPSRYDNNNSSSLAAAASISASSSGSSGCLRQAEEEGNGGDVNVNNCDLKDNPVKSSLVESSETQIKNSDGGDDDGGGIGVSSEDCILSTSSSKSTTHLLSKGAKHSLFPDDSPVKESSSTSVITDVCDGGDDSCLDITSTSATLSANPVDDDDDDDDGGSSGKQENGGKDGTCVAVSGSGNDSGENTCSNNKCKNSKDVLNITCQNSCGGGDGKMVVVGGGGGGGGNGSGSDGKMVFGDDDGGCGGGNGSGGDGKMVVVGGGGGGGISGGASMESSCDAGSSGGDILTNFSSKQNPIVNSIDDNVVRKEVAVDKSLSDKQKQKLLEKWEMYQEEEDILVEDNDIVGKTLSKVGGRDCGSGGGGGGGGGGGSSNVNDKPCRDLNTDRGSSSSSSHSGGCGGGGGSGGGGRGAKQISDKGKKRKGSGGSVVVIPKSEGTLGGGLSASCSSSSSLLLPRGVTPKSGKVVVIKQEKKKAGGKKDGQFAYGKLVAGDGGNSDGGSGGGGDGSNSDRCGNGDNNDDGMSVDRCCSDDDDGRNFKQIKSNRGRDKRCGSIDGNDEDNCHRVMTSTAGDRSRSLSLSNSGADKEGFGMVDCGERVGGTGGGGEGDEEGKSLETIPDIEVIYEPSCFKNRLSGCLNTCVEEGDPCQSFLKESSV